MSACRRVLATRRTALGGALAGAVVLAGCDLDRHEPTPSGAPSPSGSPDPDEDLLAAVRTELDSLVALVAAAAARRPSLGGVLADLATLHQAHRAVLPDGSEGPAPTPRIDGTPAAVHATVRRREERAQRRLADWAVAAQSGPLARLLASMSAGIAQHLAPVPGRAIR